MKFGWVIPFGRIKVPGISSRTRESAERPSDYREERQKWEGPALIAGPSQSAGKFGVAFRSFGT